jgi:hypothetical protein
MPQYRGLRLDLLAKCLGQTEYKFTNSTPNSKVEKICGLLEFRKLAQGEYILSHLHLPLATIGPRVVTGDHAEGGLAAKIARVATAATAIAHASDPGLLLRCSRPIVGRPPLSHGISAS